MAIDIFMIIYLDESGDLGFDFTKSKTSRYLILTILVCNDHETAKLISKSIKKTLRNKFTPSIPELKGTNTPLATKKYFLKHILSNLNWRIYCVIADKKMWLEHHFQNHGKPPQKTSFYDEIAKRLLSQVYFKSDSHIEIVVDRSKTKYEISVFDEKIISMLHEKISEKTKLSIDHHASYAQSGLQAVDLFCWGIRRKYEENDLAWYEAFSDKIAAEVIYKF